MYCIPRKGKLPPTRALLRMTTAPGLIWKGGGKTKLRGKRRGGREDEDDFDVMVHARGFKFRKRRGKEGRRLAGETVRTTQQSAEGRTGARRIGVGVPLVNSRV